MSNPHVMAVLAQGALIAGKYRLLRPLGEGAMGGVWSARNELTSGPVAIKLILSPGPELRIRLLHEAQACCQIQHKNVIQIHDVGQTESGDPFLVMELLSGETLAELLGRKRRLAQWEAAAIGRDVARALGAAHDKGIVHRDLKPANIFLHNQPGEDARVVKVLDFGVSKNLLNADGLRTRAGGPVGSPSYMSPEQARGARDIDARADIWSLGVLLFEMLTGERPFTGDADEVTDKILNAEIPLASRRVRSLDPGLDRLISSCLMRDREQRAWPISEVVEQLEPFLMEAPRATTPTLTALWGVPSAAPVPPSSRPLAAAVLPGEVPESDAETQKLDVATMARNRGATPRGTAFGEVLAQQERGNPVEPRAVAAPSLPLLPPVPRAALDTAPRPVVLPDVPSSAPSAAPVELFLATAAPKGPLDAREALSPSPSPAPASDAGAPALRPGPWAPVTPLIGEFPPPSGGDLLALRVIVACLVVAVVLVLAFTHRDSRDAAPAPVAPTATAVAVSPVEESVPSPPVVEEKAAPIQVMLPEVRVVEPLPAPVLKLDGGARPVPHAALPKPPVKCGRFVKTGCVDAASAQ